MAKRIFRIERFPFRMDVDLCEPLAEPFYLVEERRENIERGDICSRYIVIEDYSAEEIINILENKKALAHGSGDDVQPGLAGELKEIL